VLGILDPGSDIWGCQGYCRRDMLKKKRVAIFSCAKKYWKYLSEGQNGQVI
jgi:hypothetical protein